MVQGDEEYFFTLFWPRRKGRANGCRRNKLEDTSDVAEIIEQKVKNEEIKKIPIDHIIPNRFQPRTIFDDEKIEELSRTIHTHGIIQPIVVREFQQDTFEIIAGERDGGQ